MDTSINDDGAKQLFYCPYSFRERSGRGHVLFGAVMTRPTRWEIPASYPQIERDTVSGMPTMTCMHCRSTVLLSRAHPATGWDWEVASDQSMFCQQWSMPRFAVRGFDLKPLSSDALHLAAPQKARPW
jgi:hypothetical protein